MKQPTVAVCIPTYNQANYLAASVESAFSQTYSDTEVWVSDDCSTDETEAVAKTLKARFPHLHYQRQQNNLGISTNNNWLLSQPRADFIVRLDSDDLLHPEYVNGLVQLMTAHPMAGYAHCAIQEIDEHDQPRRTRLLGGRQEFQSAEQALRASTSGYRVAANICMFHAEVLRSLDYYRAEVEYVQDWDLSVRIADQGWGNVYCDKVLASYRVWEDAGQVRPRRKRTELEGYIQVFEESLAPAFEKRGWSPALLHKNRKAIALGQTVILDSKLFSATERQQLLELLNKLGPSARLSFQAKLISLGLGPALRWMNRQKLMLKDTAKQMIVASQQHRAGA